MKIKYLFLGLILCSFFGCKPAQQNQNTERIEEYKPTKFGFDYLSAKGKITYQNADDKTKASIYVRMRKDSLIWLSARVAGVEGLRALISKDSVLILDRTEKKYYEHDYEKISKELNFRVNYEMIQALIIADLPFKTHANTKINKRRNFFVRKQEINGFDIESFISRFNNRLSKIVIKEQQDIENQLLINYKDFQEIEGILMPFYNKINVNYTKNQTELITSAILDFNKIELPTEPLSFPFTVSSKYVKQ